LDPRIAGFHERSFGGVIDLDTVAELVYKRCIPGDKRLYFEGAWRESPHNIKEEHVLSFFAQLSDQLENFLDELKSTPTSG
jgi:hypothetical protein